MIYRKLDRVLQPHEQDRFNFVAASNQRDRVLSILKERPFNTIEAQKMGIMALPARILELKKIGYNIGKRKAKITTATCVKHVAEYRLLPNDEEEGK